MNSINIKEFWDSHERFLKNNLITETPDPKTHNLSKLCHTDITMAFNLFKQTELDAIVTLRKYLPNIEHLQQGINQTLTANNRIFLY
jgi:N-acetylmuramic acid 6-phosphate (MurNAc-6-P) etherase